MSPREEIAKEVMRQHLKSSTPSNRSSPSETGSDLEDAEVEIICVGLMRTGLQSLHKSLKLLGYKNIYDQDKIVTTYNSWNDVIANRDPQEAFKGMFSKSQVIMGMPTFCFWEDILQLYPNARVILTVRSEDSWWNSVNNAEIAMDHEIPGAPLKQNTVLRLAESWLVPSYYKFCQVMRFAWGTALGVSASHGYGLNEITTRSAFRRHNDYVKSYFADRKTEQGDPQLLVFDVREGWEPLCRFLGKTAPSEAFPNKESSRPWPDGFQRPEWLNKVTGFDELFAPDNDFGAKLRVELRNGLMVCALVLTVILSLSVAVTFFLFHKLSFVMGVVYLSLIIVGWSAYGVIHQLVARVPLLMVLPLALKSLFIAAALHACFISYGILKEMLVTQDKIASSLLVLSSRLMSIICACIYMLLTERRVTLGAPILSMSYFAFTNEASTWAGYEMLKYVSFPLQVMAKSVKMLPNMIMARVVTGTRHSAYQYAQAIAALVCVAIMHFSGDSADSPKKSKRGRADETMEPNYKLMMGVFMLIVFFVTDAFTSNWQTALYKKYPKMSQTQMMLGGNLIGFAFTGGFSIFANFHKITASINVAMANPAIFGRIVALGVVSALGQFCIYSAIRVLGPLSFTWIMTARQLLSVLISLIFFGHGISVVKILCILTVFAIMSAKQLGKVAPVQKVKKLARRLSGIPMDELDKKLLLEVEASERQNGTEKKEK